MHPCTIPMCGYGVGRITQVEASLDSLGIDIQQRVVRMQVCRLELEEIFDLICRKLEMPFSANLIFYLHSHLDTLLLIFYTHKFELKQKLDLCSISRVEEFING